MASPIFALRRLRFVKFGLVGAVATLTHYIVMFAGLAVWDAPVLWSFLGASAGAVTGYILNYTYTFESNRAHTETTWRYALITVLSIAANTATFFILSQLLGLDVLLAQAFSTLVVFLANYWLHKRVTFHHAGTESP